MSNILKVTTALNTNYDTSVRTGNGNYENTLNVKNPVETDKVTRPDGRPEAQNNSGKSNIELNYHSNFENFIQTLKEIPRANESLCAMLFNRMHLLGESGISKETAGQISKLFQSIRFSPENLPGFLEKQAAASNRFHGTFFDTVRRIFINAPTVELKSAMLDFLRKFSDLSSDEHLLSSIQQNLREMKGYILPDFWRTLEPLAGQLKMLQNGNHTPNIQLLEKEILPLLGKYVSSTKESGTLRNLISVLAYQISRYENGDIERVYNAYKFLQSFPSFNKALGSLSAQELFELSRAAKFQADSPETSWQQAFIHILQAGMRGEAGSDNKQIFENIIRSILINESVYMPLTHLLVPMDINGSLALSEMWIDPDDRNKNSDTGKEERGIRLLLKFSLEHTGTFEVILYYANESVELQLFYPQGLEDAESELRSGLAEILKRNHLKCDYLGIDKSNGTIPVSGVFPKIKEGRNSINVTV